VIPLADTQFVEATWIMVVKSLVIFAVIFGIVPVMTVVERKLIGRFQHRYGPNRVGPFGLLQPLADLFKLISKQGFRPDNAIPMLYVLGPLLPVISGIMALAIIPFGNVQDGVGLYGIDVPIGILYFFAVGSIAFYGVLLGGWSSGSKYSLLGAMRGAAQLISYEVSQGLALVGGYNTEYGGARFASFFYAEYLNVLVVSGIATTVFLGGWLIPGVDTPGWAQPLVVLTKMMLFVFVFIWVRATLPRLRYDQLMSFGWKVLLPVATLNVLVTAIVVTV
jgi:NADH-quinone oxidoreductase subunit H